MPARNRKSMERESAPEPANILVLLRNAHWEIQNLLVEMEDILDVPTAMFELYPRIRVALQAHQAGEQFALYAALREIPDLSELLQSSEAAHAEIDRILRALDRLPYRKQQIDSPQWKAEFRELHHAVKDHISEEESDIFPRLERLLGEARLDALGEGYKRGLKGDLGAAPAANEVIGNVFPA